MQSSQPLSDSPIVPARRSKPMIGGSVLLLLILLFFTLWRFWGARPGITQGLQTAPLVADVSEPRGAASQLAAQQSDNQPAQVVPLNDREDSVQDVPVPAQLQVPGASDGGSAGDNVRLAEEPSAPVDPSQDPENEALGGVLTVFSLEPLAAPCCPLPTDDKAVEAARSIPGVLAAKVNNDGALLVRFDPTQTNSDAIASAVNQASFIVEIAEQAE